MTILLLAIALSLGLNAADLPTRYYELLDAGISPVASRLAAEPEASLEALESRSGWRHFPSAMLAAAVLYSKQHPANPRYRDPKMLALALKIGDLVAAEHARGRYTTRLDHHRDTYMWLDAYRILNPDRPQWRAALTEILTTLAAEVARRQDYPWYNSPYIGTSPNHYSLWSSTLYLAGKVFGNAEWEKLGAKVLHRFAAEEQAPDGYWGEHSRNGPTTGYDYLTSTAVALYYEHSKDPAALEALRRSTDFHKYFTYPDGTPVETVNDRNRRWAVSPWGQFGFSHFPDGRRYAGFLTGLFSADRVPIESLGRLAQNALYFHEGPTAPIPQDLPRAARQMSVPAGVRKSGPWFVCLSGIIDTQAATSRFYLDRQGNLSVFHEKLGLIVTGANSKRQPDLATFLERIGGQVFHMPMSSRLQMSDDRDRLALSFNTFFSVLEIPSPADDALAFRFAISPRGRLADAQLNLQLCLKPGQTLETAAGRKLTLDSARVELTDLGPWLRHAGWTLDLPANARLSWPVFPHNPYADAPETDLQYAVGALSVPLRADAREIAFRLQVKE